MEEKAARPARTSANGKSASRASQTQERRERDIVLVCNPAAGGRWRQLAAILDSEVASHARRIVTDEIEDITASLRRLGKGARLICIYGGDGTILKFLNSIFPNEHEDPPTMAFIGGGTMNVSARWSGWTEKPAANFSRVVRQYMEDRLITREVPLLEVTQGKNRNYGFTFGLGPAIRVLNQYENAPKGKKAALMWAAKTIVAAYLGDAQRAPSAERGHGRRGSIDGERLPVRSIYLCVLQHHWPNRALGAPLSQRTPARDLLRSRLCGQPAGSDPLGAFLDARENSHRPQELAQADF